MKGFMEERLQKIISAAGVASRRAAEELISSGRVRVNGQVVTELGSKADPTKDHIKVDGKLINPKQPMTYIMLNKPAGYVTTMSDPEGRPTVQDLMKGVKVRVYPVGRLDYNTEGMLIMTNDGDFAHIVTHPKHELPKTYLAKIKGVLDEKAIESLETGVYLDDGRTAPAKVKKVRREETNSWVEITIHEGRKRQVRRMFDRVGRSVIKLKRTKTGNLLLRDLPEGSFRHLTHEEVQGLKDLAQSTEQGPGAGGQGQEARAAREERSVTTERRHGSNENRREAKEDRRTTSARGPKTAHKGRKPDIRPWKVTERAEDYRRKATEGRREVGEYRRGMRGEGRRWSEGNREAAGSREQGPASWSHGDKRRRPMDVRRGTRDRIQGQGSRAGGEQQGTRNERRRWSEGDRREASGRVQGTGYRARGEQRGTWARGHEGPRSGFGARSNTSSRPTSRGQTRSGWRVNGPPGTKKRR